MKKTITVTSCDICGFAQNCRSYSIERASAPSQKKRKALDLCPEHAEPVEALLQVNLRHTPAPKIFIDLDAQKQIEAPAHTKEIES